MNSSNPTESFELPAYVTSLDQALEIHNAALRRAREEDKLRVMGTALSLERFFDAFPTVTVEGGFQCYDGTMTWTLRIQSPETGRNVTHEPSRTFQSDPQAQHPHEELALPLMTVGSYFDFLSDRFTAEPVSYDQPVIRFLGLLASHFPLSKSNVTEKINQALSTCLGTETVNAWMSLRERDALEHSTPLTPSSPSSEALAKKKSL